MSCFDNFTLDMFLQHIVSVSFFFSRPPEHQLEQPQFKVPWGLNRKTPSLNLIFYSIVKDSKTSTFVVEHIPVLSWIVRWDKISHNTNQTTLDTDNFRNNCDIAMIFCQISPFSWSKCRQFGSNTTLSSTASSGGSCVESTHSGESPRHLVRSQDIW